MKDYMATIGLEIHAELKTESKMFCSCRNNPDEEMPNINICPICTGHPGTLPVLNKEAIKLVIMIGQAVGGEIADFTEWDRKNYFYPDIPKGYQISQYKYPLVKGGEISGIKITRIHLEEDTAQSTHDTHHKSLINFSRAGVPLMELVTKPVIHDTQSAVTFAKELRLLLRYLGAGEANLEKGEMRIEANISVASKKDTEAGKFGTKTEVKNLNSFRSVEKAIAYEIKRQIELLEKEEKVIQETRGWDDKKGETYSQRLKESSHDYRYFPEPDIPKLKISEVKEFQNLKLVEPPWDTRKRFTDDYEMTEKEVEVFVESPEIADYFDTVVRGNEDIIRFATNYILNDYLGLIKRENKKISTINPKIFSEIMDLINKKILQSNTAKNTIALMVKGNESEREDILNKYKNAKKMDDEEIRKIMTEIIEKNSTVVEDYKKGKVAALQYLVGQGMKLTRGEANPEIIKKIILELIG